MEKQLSSTQRRAAAAFAWNHVARTGDYLLAYISSVVIARFLGAETYGAYAVFLSAVQMLIVLSSYGLESSIVSTLPEASGATADLHRGRSISLIVLVRLAGIAVVAACAAILRFVPAALHAFPAVLADYLGVLLLLYFFRNLVSLFSALHIAALDTKRLAVTGLLARSLELTGVVTLLALHRGLPDVFILITITSALQLCALLPGSGVVRTRAGRGEGEASRVIRMGGAFWLNGLMEFILGRQADVILLGLFLVGQDSIGRYDASLGLAQGINAGMTAGFMGVATASFTSMTGLPQSIRNAYWEHLSRVIIILVVPVLILVVVAADDIIPALYSRDFLSGILFFRVFALTLVATRFLGGGLAANFLSSMGRTDILLRSSVLSGVTNLFFALLLIPRWGALGAVIASSAGAIAMVALQAYFTRRLVRISFPWKFGVQITLLSILCAFAASRAAAAVPISGIWGTGVLFVCSFLLLLFFVKPFCREDYEHLREMSGFIADLARPFTRFVPRHSNSLSV